jgi:glutathione S-transferase
MLLRYSVFSPFARKVRVCAEELGLGGRITLVDTNPHQDTTLRALNPLCKVPTLVMDDGTPLFDSTVICRFLASAVGDEAIVPLGGERWTVLRDEALGDGICDAAVALRTEKLQEAALRSEPFIGRQTQAILAGCDVLERDVARLEARVDIGVIAIACGLGYLDLRHPDLGWRRGRPALASWHATFEARDSMNLTRAPLPPA